MNRPISIVALLIAVAAASAAAAERHSPASSLAQGSSSSASGLAMLFESLGEVYDTARLLQEMEAQAGRLPRISGPAELSQAKFGNDLLVDLLKDPWGTPLHVESSPDSGYLVAAAGSDRSFDRSSWSNAGSTTSTADDIVFRNGKLVRSPLQWAEKSAMEAIGDPAEQATRDLARSRHDRTVADLRAIAVAMAVYQADGNPLPPAKSIDELARHLEPKYIGKLPRTDGWGHPFHVALDQAKSSVTVVSAGPDGVLNRESWTDPSRASDDIVIHDGEITRNAELERPQSADPELEMARATMRMFDELAQAINAYRLDRPHLPKLTSIEQLSRALVPTYALSVPAADAWGTPLLVRTDGAALLVISAGSDRAFDSSRWNETVATSDHSRDLVIRDGRVGGEWDVNDPTDRLSNSLRGFWASRQRFEESVR